MKGCRPNRVSICTSEAAGDADCAAAAGGEGGTGAAEPGVGDGRGGGEEGDELGSSSDSVTFSKGKVPK